MVQQQLCSLERLMNSGYGHPYPRHGLQLLFWFANNCVTCESVNVVIVLKLVSDCQPERGSYGFHWFGNAEQLLPVMNRPRKSKSKKQVVYFEVGNLNTETYPGSADLPEYVRENYGSDGGRGISNIDRIIISCQVRARVVDSVYVTEHDRTGSGRFSLERTYQISSKLIQALQSPLLDVTTFLTQMGYYANIWECQGYSTQDTWYPDPSAQTVLQPYIGSTPTIYQNYDLAFQQQVYSYDQQTLSTAQYNRQSAFREMEHMFRTARYPPCGWYDPYEGFDEKPKKRKGGGGFSFVKLLLCAGTIYLAVRCLRWLRSWCQVSYNEYLTMMTTWRSPCPQQTHVMLDYVY